MSGDNPIVAPATIYGAPPTTIAMYGGSPVPPEGGWPDLVPRIQPWPVDPIAPHYPVTPSLTLCPGCARWIRPGPCPFCAAKLGATKDTPVTPPPAPQHDAIVAMCEELKGLLLAKNAAYGNSALAPLRVFSKASAKEQLLVRIDDKLSRLMQGTPLPDEALEDTVLDLIGYLTLLRIAMRSDGG